MEKIIANTTYLTATIGLLGVIIGVILNIIGNVVLQRFAAAKERRQEILKRELDRLYRLEEMAGEITEWAGSYQLDHSSDDLRGRFKEFTIAAGTFRKYPKLKQAIRDLNHYAMILVSNEQNHRDAKENSGGLEEKYKAFLAELKVVLDGIKT